ncbi:MAG: response regulator [Candidatus Rokubacteria bacterium]|nr:response regulator [Candidatus Rokubacteria bacterium]
MADRGQIEQVVMNLVVNARDAMPQGGALVVETADVELTGDDSGRRDEVAPGPYVMLAVTDTGSGMDAATQARVFEPFFTTKMLAKGTGLGLATVYGIVKQSNGHVWLSSEPGRGTTFRVYLPRVDGPAAAVVPEGRTEVIGGTETILLAEDDVDVRGVTRETLALLGYTVLDADGPESALRLARDHASRIDLLVTDVVMPGMNGRQLAERVVELHPEAQVLYISGYTANIVAHHGVLEAGTDLLEKPFSAERLGRKVRDILDRPRPINPSRGS